jgi:hypothetical protein
MEALIRKADELYVDFPEELKKQHLKTLMAELLVQATASVYGPDSNLADADQDESVREIAVIVTRIAEEEFGLVFSVDELYPNPASLRKPR